MIRIAFPQSDNFTAIVGRNAPHVVVNGRDNRNGCFGYIDTGEHLGAFRNAGQSLVDHFRPQVHQVEVDMITLIPETTTFVDFLCH